MSLHMRWWPHVGHALPTRNNNFGQQHTRKPACALLARACTVACSCFSDEMVGIHVPLWGALKQVFPGWTVQFVVVLGQALDIFVSPLGLIKMMGSCSARQRIRNFAADLSGGVLCGGLAIEMSLCGEIVESVCFQVSLTFLDIVWIVFWQFLT